MYLIYEDTNYFLIKNLTDKVKKASAEGFIGIIDLDNKTEICFSYPNRHERTTPELSHTRDIQELEDWE